MLLKNDFVRYLENKFLLETIKSRCFNCRIFINSKEKTTIKEKLIAQFNTNNTIINKIHTIKDQPSI